jgi:hypothetical protein
MPRDLRPYAWLLGVLWGLPLLVTAVGYAVLPKDVGPEECEGIGFGCALSPADTLLLLAGMASVALVPAGILGVVVIAVLQARRARRSSSGPTVGPSPLDKG